jgi:hypothetical protein
VPTLCDKDPLPITSNLKFQRHIQLHPAPELLTCPNRLG